MLGKVELRCPICGDIFYKYPSELKKTCGKAECVAEMKRRNIRLPSVGFCSVCGKRVKLMRRGRKDPPLCKRCWTLEYRTGKCKNCGMVKILFSQGHCSLCFVKLGLNTRKIICRRCRRKRPHYARGLCVSCYVGEMIRKRQGRESGFLV